MTAYVALLRAVNVGGTAKLPMSELTAIGEACGFDHVRTFIASGNLLFCSDEDEAAVAGKVAAGVARFFGRDVPAFIRTAEEMAAVVGANPFPHWPANRVTAYFMDAPPSATQLAETRGVVDEQIARGAREIYIAYGDDMGHSKLRLPASAIGTARNMNSVAKMAALLAAMP